MGFVDSCMQRLRKLRLSQKAAGVEDDLALIQEKEEHGDVDYELQESVDTQITSLEKQAETESFLPPPEESGLSDGDIHILDVEDGENEPMPIRITFKPRTPTSVLNMVIVGTIGSGKSIAVSNVLIAASATHPTFAIDPNRTFREITRMRETHTFVSWRDLRFNLFDCPDGLDPQGLDQMVLGEIADFGPLIYGEYELGEQVKKIRSTGQTPNLPDLLGIVQKTYASLPNFDKQRQYLYSALLVLSRLLTGTKNLFMARHGMPLERLLRGNVVLEVDSLQPEYQAFLIGFIFEYLHLLAVSGRKFSPDLLFSIDEAQILHRSSTRPSGGAL